MLIIVIVLTHLSACNIIWYLLLIVCLSNVHLVLVLALISHFEKSLSFNLYAPSNPSSKEEVTPFSDT